MPLFISYLISLISLIALDVLRLGVIMKKTISWLLWPLMREQFLVRPALAFYCLYVVAILVFAVMPAVKANSWSMAMMYGAFLWFTAYMTYDLTNWATLKDWPAGFVAMDIAWGTVVTMVVAVIGYRVMKGM